MRLTVYVVAIIELKRCNCACIHTYIHTYMNRPITAPELESKKLKCVQVNERVPDGYWPISS